MRVSQLFGVTLRGAPADELESHRLLLRAGYVQQLAAGLFSYLPLGWRSQEKIRRILREEMDAIGGQEINMPVVHPGELWQRSGRWQDIDQTLARWQDRRGRDMVLALSHEEVVAELAITQVSSYRDLPRLVYQIQTKFRDELRTRGGLVRVREFVMKDGYSLDRDQAGLRRQYLANFRAYFRIAARAGIPVVAVLSDVGVMGGSLAHEFIYLTEVGEDTLVFCHSCGYAANLEVAQAADAEPPQEDRLPLEEVQTPGAETAADVARFLGVEQGRVAKTVGYAVPAEGAPAQLVLAVVPGDAEVNLARLRQVVAAAELRPANAEELRSIGAEPGYMSPRGQLAGKARVVVDAELMRRPNLVAGANRPGVHLRNFNMERDAHIDEVTNLAEVRPGQPCSNCGAPLELRRGIEFGNIFQLGTRYADRLGAHFTDENGEQRPIVMGSYGIGLSRMLACAAEEHHDGRGLALPVSIAPFQACLVSVGAEAETVAEADGLYRELEQAGVEVLYDDRDASPGVKFADADLRGMPVRLTVSPRARRAGGVEIKPRSGEARVVSREATVRETVAELARLQDQLDRATDQATRQADSFMERAFGPGD